MDPAVLLGQESEAGRGEDINSKQEQRITESVEKYRRKKIL